MINIITLKDIHKAVITKVTNALKDTAYKDIKFSSTDIIENIIRPSFYLDIDNSKVQKFNSKTKGRNLKVRLFYFSKNKDNSKLELMDIQDILENIFLEEISLLDGTFNFPIGEIEIEANKKDGYLTINLELESWEDIDFINTEYDNKELMEELNLKITNN